MESDSFAQHHPHTLGDYLSRGLVLFVYRTAKVVFHSSYAEHALVLEATLSSMLTSAATHLQYTALRNLRADRARIEDLLGEASSEHLHLLVLKRVQTLSWLGRTAIWKMQFIYVPLFRLLYIISPSAAHRLIAYSEERLAGIYADWLLELLCGASENAPAPLVAIQYWELGEEATLVELVNVLIADTAKNRDRNHAIADQK
ncbi:MAG TPA: alternative oxidase [Candidatus Paceibacterota bacterium]|nr:alternative oxidase [Candidatus Paceibacterota bacterium]